MITSLNVNNFAGQEEWVKLQGESTKKISIWNEQKDYYFNYIKNHLISDEDIVILHEVPYIKEKAYTYNNETKYKRNVIMESDFIQTTSDKYVLKSGYKVGDKTLDVFDYYNSKYEIIEAFSTESYKRYDIGNGYTLEIGGDIEDDGKVHIIIINRGYNIYV